MANGISFLFVAPKGTPPAVVKYIHDAAKAAAQSCNGTARSYTTDGSNSWPHASVAVTTSNCYDINVKPSAGTSVRGPKARTRRGVWGEASR